MNKKFALYFILMVVAAPIAFSGTSVDGLHLKSINGETVLKIDVGGPFQFTHQIEEAKDGKPYRIIVDIFPAVHNLNQKTFANLPVSIISAVRTSQYSVKPEKIVRVVLDLKNSSIYRIEKSGNFAFIYIPDSENSNFIEWSSNGGSESFSAPQKEFAKAEAPESVTSVAADAPEVYVAPQQSQFEPPKD